MADKTTQPINQEFSEGEAHLTIAATYKDQRTGATYVHRDLVRVQDAWAEEEHLSPMKTTEQFGDVESWVLYVKRYGDVAMSHLTWNKNGLRAVLDHANADTDAPGRCQWGAIFPFVPSRQWVIWTRLACNEPVPQKLAVEKLEDLAEDIVDPAPTVLMNLLRNLRATVNAKAEAELRPDGTHKVSFERDARVATASAVELPASFWVSIPILKGHVNEKGEPIAWKFEVRLRVSIGESDPKLALRFAIPTAEQILEDAYLDRVKAAKTLLSTDFALLRAADA